MKYIITSGQQIGNPVLTSEQINDYIKQGYRYKERIYKMTVYHREHEIVCAEIWRNEDKEHSVIIPAYLLPRKAYPLDVYIFAVNLYSGDPNMSQRAAAEETKNHFGLEKFSHTTIGRTMKTLSEKLEEYEVVSASTVTVGQMEEQKDIQNDVVDKTIHKKRFLTVQDTKKRREIIGKFLKDKLCIEGILGFVEACRRIAIWWYLRFNRLLI